MSLFSIEEIAPDVLLGLWKIDETAEDVFFNSDDGLCALKPEIHSITSMRRRFEILAVHSLLRRMLNCDVKLFHNDDGKPFLDNGVNVSISHTKGCAAVIISQNKRVAVDIEYVSDRVGHIAGKLLRSDERADTTLEKLLHWCTKETLYKLYSEKHLALLDMQLLSIHGNDDFGIITAKNVVDNDIISVNYRIFNGLVLTYVVL